MSVSRVTVHGLRHLTATLTLTTGVPLAIASVALRHFTLSTTAHIYSHLTHQADHDTSRRPWPAWLRPHRAPQRAPQPVQRVLLPRLGIDFADRVPGQGTRATTTPEHAEKASALRER
ncbi:hypothetical protein [Streptomyces rhizosphaericus]|uniref:Tyrosine-type recombinase/integrase n=1 Tax=Streptomyces rhizosphaericus TaxID=114699 RepID=A0A6G4AH98_9ACTN|nr:hypothetical protein [Streptomyces rhizosphaericus]NEW72608.1 hypothetical protein [Streptomyces rhizosphaericus]